jgi:hypothetical protein
MRTVIALLLIVAVVFTIAWLTGVGWALVPETLVTFAVIGVLLAASQTFVRPTIAERRPSSMTGGTG